MAVVGTTHVMDALGVTAWVRREQGAHIVDGILADPNASRFVHAVNLCEICYDSLRDAVAALGQYNILFIR